jgi:tRNA A37 threonylcarbamoyladenosine synthetase subunit TsaC/SUA5/YrdC
VLSALGCPLLCTSCTHTHTHTQAVLAALGRPLLCTSVHVAEHIGDDTECPDLGSMLESYGASGIDFIIDVGPRIATVSTVVDMTGTDVEVVRVGRGDPGPFE